MPDREQEVAFRFSLAKATERAAVLDPKISVLTERIDRYIKEATLDGIRILEHLLRMTDDIAELDRLGRALVRIAPIIKEQNALKLQRKLFDLAISDTSRLALMFGDFDDEVSALLPPLPPPDDSEH